MPLRLLTDECVSQKVVDGLRRRAVDVETSAKAGLLGAEDERYIDRALADGRVLVTSDYDFLQLTSERLGQGLETPKIIFIKQRSSVGSVVRAIAAIREAEMSAIEWVP